jgi:hypothetical protein
MMFTYKAQASGHKLRIGIECRVVDLDEFVGDEVFEAEPGVYLGGRGLPEDQREWLLYGVSLLAEAFTEKTDRFDVVVEVLRLDIAPETYQVEGLAPAVAGWLASAYSLDYTPPPIRYDDTAGRFVFDFVG